MLVISFLSILSNFSIINPMILVCQAKLPSINYDKENTPAAQVERIKEGLRDAVHIARVVALTFSPCEEVSFFGSRICWPWSRAQRRAH